MQYEISALVVVDAANEDQAYERAREIEKMSEDLNNGAFCSLLDDCEEIWPPSEDPREVTAQDLERVDWFGPAGDIRDGLDPDTVLDRIRQSGADEEELERAEPILARLATKIE